MESQKHPLDKKSFKILQKLQNEHPEWIVLVFNRTDTVEQILKQLGVI